MHPDASDPDFLGLSVLLLEDRRFDAELAIAALGRSFPSVTVDRAEHGDRFEQFLRSRPHDVILSDVDLPSYSGREALALAQRLRPGTPFIFLSGATPEECVAELLRAGATDFVSKDRLERLSIAVARALRESRDKRTLEHALEERQRSNAFVEGVLDSLRGHAVIGVDPDGDIIEWNRAAMLMFGYTREEAIGRHVSLVYAKEGAAEFAQDSDAARRLGTSVDTRQLRRSDGTMFPSDGVMTVLRDPLGEVAGYLKLARDMTASRAAAAALRAAKDDAERANRAKDRFLAVLSHELRAPLTPIASAAAVLETAALSSQQQKLLAMIRRNIALEARLIDDLFDLSAISSGKLPLKLQCVDMRAVVNAALDMVRSVATTRRITLSLDWQADLYQVDGDPARLQQILWNLLRNAVKFSFEDGRIDITVRRVAKELRIAVQDHGVGILAAALPVIFDPFSQADEHVTRRYGGLGLGLSIAKSLAESHRGALHAHSDGENCGARFTLSLPALEAVRLPAIQNGTTELERRGLRILLVEDDADTAEAMTLSLEAHGHSLTHAPSLRDASAALACDSFDAVLADLGLPDGSGLSLPRVGPANTPFIALSGFGGPESLARSLAAGFRAHLVKPATLDDVREALRSACEATS